MKTNAIAKLFKGRAKPETKVTAIMPQRQGERTLLGVENLLGSIAVPEPFSLEIVGDAAGVNLLARCRSDEYTATGPIDAFDPGS